MNFKKTERKGKLIGASIDDWVDEDKINGLYPPAFAESIINEEVNAK